MYKDKQQQINKNLLLNGYEQMESCHKETQIKYNEARKPYKQSGMTTKRHKTTVRRHKTTYNYEQVTTNSNFSSAVSMASL